MKFQIEQIALYPSDPQSAMELLSAIGAAEWVHDEVKAHGQVFGQNGSNEGQLHFNYDMLVHARELEVLQYDRGPNWMDLRPNADPCRVSHLGMHCSAEELEKWRAFFNERRIGVAQEVKTTEHTNPAIAGQRWYHYVIFDTHEILGVDLKFIVRYDSAPV